MSWLAQKFIVVVDEPADYEIWKTKQEAWLKLNPDFKKYVPENLREVADIKSGIAPSGVAAN
jgi:cytochrome c oxidase subunit II